MNGMKSFVVVEPIIAFFSVKVFRLFVIEFEKCE